MIKFLIGVVVGFVIGATTLKGKVIELVKKAKNLFKKD